MLLLVLNAKLENPMFELFGVNRTEKPGYFFPPDKQQTGLQSLMCILMLYTVNWMKSSCQCIVIKLRKKRKRDKSIEKKNGINYGRICVHCLCEHNKL